MKILVLGGTGTVGSAVVPALVAKGHAVRVMTRSAEKARSAPESGPAAAAAWCATPTAK